MVTVAPTGATVTNGTNFVGTAPAFSIVNVSSQLGFVSTAANPSFVVRIYRVGVDTPDITYNIAW